MGETHEEWLSRQRDEERAEDRGDRAALVDAVLAVAKELRLLRRMLRRELGEGDTVGGDVASLSARALELTELLDEHKTELARVGDQLERMRLNREAR